MRRGVAGLAVVLALSACEGGGDPVEQALREASAANHSATVRDQTTTVVRPASEATADAAYVARMIEHHRAAVAMADAALAESGDPELRRMAQAAKDVRTREIAALQAWKPDAAPAP